MLENFWLLKRAVYARKTYGSNKKVYFPFSQAFHEYVAEHFFRITDFSIERYFLASTVCGCDGP
jgi:hypothetical protein